MKKSLLFLVVILVAFLTSCQSDNELIPEDSELLVGHWVSPVYVDSLVLFTRADALKENDFGISFYKDDKLIERQNAGWCGTPPISFGNYNGTWSKNGDYVDISVDFWGGKASYKWKIVDINTKTLTIYKVNAEYVYKDR